MSLNCFTWKVNLPIFLLNILIFCGSSNITEINCNVNLVSCALKASSKPAASKQQASSFVVHPNHYPSTTASKYYHANDFS